MLKKARIILSLLFFCCYSYVLAENPSPGQQPGAQAQRYKEDVQQQRQKLEYKQPKKPEIKVEEKESEPTKGGVSFLLKEVKVSGATIFKPQDFRQICVPYLNKNVTFYDMDQVAKKIEGK